MSIDDKKDKKGQRGRFARVTNAFKSTSQSRNSAAGVASSSVTLITSSCMTSSSARHVCPDMTSKNKTKPTPDLAKIAARSNESIKTTSSQQFSPSSLSLGTTSAVTFCEETTPNTETNEIIGSPTESTMINTFPHPSIALVEQSSTNNESVDNSDSPENLATLSSSPHGSIQLEESRPSRSRDPFGDRERTEDRYKKAIKWLEESLKLPRSNLEPFVIPDFTDISENDSLPQLRQEIKKILDVRSSSIKDRNFWSKGKHIADRELARKQNVEKTLDYISHQLGQLQVLKQLPDAGLQSEALINRAMDVLSAILNYLAMHIRCGSSRLGIIGNIATTFVKGDKVRESVDIDLRNAVNEFNSTLSNFGHNVGFRTFELVEGLARKLHVQISDVFIELRQDFAIIRQEKIDNLEHSVPLKDRFMVPYDRNENFIGREGLLMKLRIKLCEIVPKRWNHRVALYGLGGVGKTQLALQYVHMQKDNYEWIYWISAVSEAALFSGFQEIAKRTRCLSDYANLKPKEVADHVLSWMNEQQSWLLVIDNLDDVEVVDGYLPNRSPNKHTLITTRKSHCHHIPAEGLQVDVLNIDDATNLLFHRSNIEMVSEMLDKKAEGVEIVQELGCLPLAIEQAAAYIREASKNMFEFLPSYRNSRKIHHARSSKGNRCYYKESVTTTWRLSFQQIEENNVDASNLLRLLAFLNPDGILTDFLEAGKEGLDAELREIFTNSVRFYEALGELERFSLIGRQDDGVSGQRITIHRLVQSVIKDEMPQELFSTMTMTLIGLCDCAFPPWHNWQNDLLLRSRRYQDQVIMPLSSIQHINSIELSGLLQRVAFFLRQEGKYQQASELIRNAIDILSATRGSEHHDTLAAMASLASTYRDQGQWDDAVKLKEKVLELSRRLLGENHLDTLNAMANLAVTYHYQGRWEDAINLEEKVLETSRKLLGEEHFSTLSAMAYLAMTYRRQGRWEDAVRLDENVLEVRRRLLGEEQLDTLSAMANLGVNYKYQGRWGDAVKLEEKVFEARRRLLGEDNLSTLSAMANLAVTYRFQGRWDHAVKLEEKVMEVRKRLLGEEHHTTLSVMEHLAATYIYQGRWEDALNLDEKVLEARRRLCGEKHPDTLSAMANTAKIYLLQGRWDDAVRLEEKVLKDRRRLLGHEHPNTLSAMAILAATYRVQGRWDDAAKLGVKALEARERILGKEHPDTLTAMENLAATYRVLGRWDDAVKLEEKVLKDRRRLLQEEHPDTLSAMANLAAIYQVQGRWEDAVKPGVKALEARERILGKEHPDTLTAMENLGCIYRDQGSLDDSNTLLERSAEVRKRILGYEHPETLGAMTNLAILYQKQGKLVESMVLLEKTEEAMKRILGNEHPNTLWTMSCLALAYRKDGKLANSIGLLEKVLEARKRVLGEHHPYTVCTVNDLESVHRCYVLGHTNMVNEKIISVHPTTTVP